ncbi:hypothetical protein M2103_001601 [Ereboglobus sp. PH5-5]|nr:hypothetical protein [Ereboglobus sp. PH5-10]MDF9833377.1 hypothetical protein [Ereboglobus sp. PH5-5]
MPRIFHPRIFSFLGKDEAGKEHAMKKPLLNKCFAGLTAGFAILALTGCPSGNSTKKVVGTVTKKTVETAKGVFSGISEGIDEGRKQTTGVDGASVATTFAEMQGKVSFEILSVEDDETRGAVIVTLGLANETDAPIRVSGLAASDQVMLLDKSGYVARVQRAPTNVTIPAMAKEKARLEFTGKAADFATLRLLGGEVSLNERE